jgi:hypothetical protein
MAEIMKFNNNLDWESLVSNEELDTVNETIHEALVTNKVNGIPEAVLEHISDQYTGVTSAEAAEAEDGSYYIRIGLSIGIKASSEDDMWAFFDSLPEEKPAVD